MTFHSIAAVLASTLLTVSVTKHCFCAPVDQIDSRPDFHQLLQRLAGFSPDPCGPPYGVTETSAQLESMIFEQAADFVTQGLNVASVDPGSPKERAARALKKLEQLSAEVNAAWPDENRFHFAVLDLPPALVIKLTVRTQGKFFVFGVPEEDSGKPNRLWKRVGSDDEESGEHVWPQLRLKLYPLHRGPSGNARFLARFDLSSCAGSTGVNYDAREWDPKGTGGLEQIIKQAGSFGLDDVAEFRQIGKLRTKGTLIALPYCWFSAIDTWDNPSLCALDTYDISGDNVRFRSRTYNRPDLLPIVRAIEYAQQRDHPAVLAYCASGKVARSMVRDIPLSVGSEAVLKVTRSGQGKESVDIGEYRFDVEKRGDRWLVVAFHAK